MRLEWRRVAASEDVGAGSGEIDIADLARRGVPCVPFVDLEAKVHSEDDSADSEALGEGGIRTCFEEIGLGSALSSSCVVRWRRPGLFPQEGEVRLMDLSSEEVAPEYARTHLLLARECLGGFCQAVLGRIPEAAWQIERNSLRAEACRRVWEASTAALREILGGIESAYSELAADVMPKRIPHQIDVLGRSLVRPLFRSLDRVKPVSRTGSLSVRVLFEPEQPWQEVVRSGLVSFKLGSWSNREVLITGSITPRASLRDLASGFVESAGLPERVDEIPSWLPVIDRISEWFLESGHASVNVLITETIDGVAVAKIRALDPTIDDAILLAAESLPTDPQRGSAFVSSIRPSELGLLLRPRLSVPTDAPPKEIAQGIPSSPGACSATLCLSPETAERLTRSGTDFVFAAPAPVAHETGIYLQAAGLVFSAGGTTSHVAVIARGRGAPCVMSAHGLTVSKDRRQAQFGNTLLGDGDFVTVDGTKGRVYAGKVDVEVPKPSEKQGLNVVLDWCDTVAGVSVYANADTEEEIRTAIARGAKGVGLLRLEHLLTRPGILPAFRRTLALVPLVLELENWWLRSRKAATKWPESPGARAELRRVEEARLQHRRCAEYLRVLEELQYLLKQELASLLYPLGERPVVVRLVDPPISEFLDAEVLDELTDALGLNRQERTALEDWANDRTMMAVRGARLALLAPSFTRATVRALADAVASVRDPTRIATKPQVLLPFVSDPFELDELRGIISDCGSTEFMAKGQEFEIGAMIETPRAVLLAGPIAARSSFLSLGTNDLAQFTWAASRDTAEQSFLCRSPYQDAIEVSPFQGLDEAGVGELVGIAVERARTVNPSIRIGICGEQAAQLAAIPMIKRLRIDYISCASSFIPVSRLVLGQLSGVLEGTVREDNFTGA